MAGNKRSIFGAKLGDGVIFAVTLILAALSFFPVYFTVMSAFKTNGEILRNPIALPSAFRVDNFVYLWSKTRIPQAALNSAFLTLVSTALMILVIPMSAYAIERRKTRLSKFLYSYFIAGMMIPFQVYMIPLFRQLRVIGLFGTLYGPIVVYVSGATAFGTLLYCSFIKSIPREIEEAAAIDGYHSFAVFWKIVFPLLGPCTASMIILQGLGIWNDFLMPLMVMPANRPKTINVEIFSYIGEFQIRWDILFSGTLCAMLPILLIFAFLQKYFVSGIMAGTLKE
jgi:raffinose/stachyose/melibiose transport system permease protein